VCVFAASLDLIFTIILVLLLGCFRVSTMWY